MAGRMELRHRRYFVSVAAGWAHSDAPTFREVQPVISDGQGS